jgi:glycosyltransferase involved in cell wall biosynthesis
VPRTIIVVPCYNEAERLAVDEFEAFMAREPSVHFVFVNDGSSDGTLGMLGDLEKRAPSAVTVIDQQPNRGKAEAVRRGLLEAFDLGSEFVGYWDADLATPLGEIPLFVDTFEEHPERELILGSRVKLLGRDIHRSNLRHYLGRVAATLASRTLRLDVYDTQCGAKLIRATPAMRALFEEPFCTGWVFDVEMIARLCCQRAAAGGPGAEAVIYEQPLRQWHDIAGSKVKPTDFLRAFVELARIDRRYMRAGTPRAAHTPGPGSAA